MKKKVITLIPLLTLLITGCKNSSTSAISSSVPTSSTSIEEQHDTVTLSDTHISLRKGMTYTLTCTSEKEVTWSSSNEEVCTVSNGTITAVNSGTSYIRAENEEDYALCLVTVLEDNFDKVFIETKIDSLNLFEGDTYSLYASLRKGKDNVDVPITYSSSNEELATVSQSGLIVALKAGDVNINLKATYENIEYSKTIALTIYSDSIAITTNYLNKVITVDDTLDLSIAVSYKGKIINPSSYSVSFSSSDNQIASINNKTLTALDSGTVKITATVTYDGNVYTLDNNITIENYHYVIIRVDGETYSSTKAKNGDIVKLVAPEIEYRTFTGFTLNGEKYEDDYVKVGDENIRLDANFIDHFPDDISNNFSTNNTLYSFNGTPDINYRTKALLPKGSDDSTCNEYGAVEINRQWAAIRYNLDKSYTAKKGVVFNLRLYCPEKTSLLYFNCESNKPANAKVQIDAKKNVWYSLEIASLDLFNENESFNYLDISSSGYFYLDEINVVEKVVENDDISYNMTSPGSVMSFNSACFKEYQYLKDLPQGTDSSTAHGNGAVKINSSFQSIRYNFDSPVSIDKTIRLRLYRPNTTSLIYIGADNPLNTTHGWDYLLGNEDSVTEGVNTVNSALTGSKKVSGKAIDNDKWIDVDIPLSYLTKSTYYETNKTISSFSIASSNYYYLDEVTII